MNETTRAAESYQVEHAEALGHLEALETDPGRPAWLHRWLTAQDEE